MSSVKNSPYVPPPNKLQLGTVKQPEPPNETAITQKEVATEVAHLKQVGKNDGVDSKAYQHYEAKVGNDLASLMNFKDPRDATNDVNKIATQDPFLTQIKAVLNSNAATLDSSMQQLRSMLQSSEYRSNPMRELAVGFIKNYYQTKSIRDGNQLALDENKVPVPNPDNNPSIFGAATKSAALETDRNNLTTDLKNLLNIGDVAGAQTAVSHLFTQVNSAEFPVLAQVGKVLDAMSSYQSGGANFSTTQQLSTALTDLTNMKSNYSQSPFLQLLEPLQKEANSLKSKSQQQGVDGLDGAITNAGELAGEISSEIKNIT